MKCKICKIEIIEKEIKEKILCEFNNFYFRKIIYKQEFFYCNSCKNEYIDTKSYNMKKQALKELKKIPWAEIQ